MLFVLLRRIFLFILVVCHSASFSAENEKIKILVRGAGPAGLAAAVGAQLAGCDVLVIEKRLPEDKKLQQFIVANADHTDNHHPWASRIRMVSLDEDANQILKKFGADAKIFHHSNTYQVFYDVKDSKAVSFGIGHGFDLVARNAMPGRYVTGMAAIRDIERVLLDRFLELGGKIRFGSTSAEDFDPDFTLIAEGARSTTAKELSFETNSFGLPETQWIVGTFQLDHPNIQNKTVWETRNDKGVFSTAAIADGRATIYASPKETIQDVDQAALIKEFAARLNVQGKLLEVQEFKVTPEHVTEFYKDSVYLIGDSVRKIDPSTGYGVTLALKDGLAMHEFFTDFNHQKLDAYYEASLQMTERQLRWIKLVRKYMFSRVGQAVFKLGFPILRKYYGAECERDLLGEN